MDEVIDLMREKDRGSFDSSNVDVALMGGRLEPKFRVSKDAVNMLFPKAVGPWVSLKSTEDRKDYLAVQLLPESFEAPFIVGIIDANKSG
jgi:hypothetical protein